MKDIIELAVIGGGASGITAAITAARRIGGKNVLLLEKQSRIGRKLLATGNGRCNIGNKNISIDHYFGDKQIAQNVINSFNVQQLKRFFGSLGLLIKEDPEGRLYPYSNQATTVLDCMRNELKKLGVIELCDVNIRKIQKHGSFFEIFTDDKTFRAEKIIVSCGTKATPSLGSDDSGLRLLKYSGIESSPLFPSLSPIKTIEKFKTLKGVRSAGKVTIVADNEVVRTKSGEIQFSDSGVSGICVFECSRFVNEYLSFGTVNGKPVRDLSIRLDLMPNFNDIEILRYLRSCKGIFAELPCEMILSGALNKKLSEAVCRYAGLNNKYCSKLDENELRKLAESVKCFTFTPEKNDSFQSAQVCAGGVGSDEVYPDSLMSRKISDLYICGEMLNVDGDCGGYNLHFAFGSGIIAARNIK